MERKFIDFFSPSKKNFFCCSHFRSASLSLTFYLVQLNWWHEWERHGIVDDDDDDDANELPISAHTLYVKMLIDVMNSHTKNSLYENIFPYRLQNKSLTHFEYHVGLTEIS